jgi:hypothetical protein
MKNRLGKVHPAQVETKGKFSLDSCSRLILLVQKTKEVIGMNDYQQPEPIRQYEPPPVEQAPVMSLMDWVVVLILTALPIVNIIMLIIWTVGENVNPNKKNYARAALIMTAISIVFFVAFMGRMLGTFLSMMEQISLNF